jgi:arginine deiminase
MTPADLPAAFGGPGWSPRTRAMREEIGDLWGDFAVDSEVGRLHAVLLHRPGPELDRAAGDDAALMLSASDTDTARRQHGLLAAAYEEEGIEVHRVDPPVEPPPNQMFCADLFFMTPEGAILARPASTVRAGEERWVARRLADLGIPIARSISGSGTFEGADAQWLDPGAVLLSRGLRTNAEGVRQVRETLEGMGVRVIVVDLPYGAMHLMGQIRFLDRDLAIVRRGRLALSAVEAMREMGNTVLTFPDDGEIDSHYGHNFVTLAPRRILIPAGNPITQRLLEENGVECRAVEIGELSKAAGGIGCLTGILARESIS